MTTYFVSRHRGAVEWAATHGVRVDRLVEHLDLDEVVSGDVIIGTLPVHLAGEVCRKGARYFHLSMDTPPELRGRDLSAAQLDDLGARLIEFKVVELTANAPTRSTDPTAPGSGGATDTERYPDS